MNKAIIVIILLAALALIALNFKPLVLGMAGNTFVSPAQPGFAFSPKVENLGSSTLALAKKCNLYPEITDSRTTVHNVLAYYAYYINSEDKFASELLCLMAVNQDDSYAWLIDGSSAFQEYNKKYFTEQNIKIEALSFILPKNSNPFGDLSQNDDYLVRRFSFYLFQRKAKVILEYREPAPKQDIFADPKANAAFEERAAKAFQIYTNPKQLPQVTEAFLFDDNMLRQNKLSQYIGKTTLINK